MEFVYDKSFRTQLFSGGRYWKRLEKQPILIDFHWPKWIENPEMPNYAMFTSITVLFNPFYKDVKASKKMVLFAKETGFKYIGLCELYVVNTIQNKLARIDLNTFIKVIYFYLKEMKGQLYYKNKLYNSELFYKAFKDNINSKFSRKLTKKDFEIINVLDHFEKLDKV